MDRDPIITADDVMRAGACFDGVMQVVSRFQGKIAAAMPVSAVLRMIPKNDRHYVLKAADLNGNGDGDGNGYGDGNGDGYGYGNGDGGFSEDDDE